MERRAEQFDDVVRHWCPNRTVRSNRKWPGADQRGFDGQVRDGQQAFSVG
jgi:hypothetical protein